MWHHLSYLQVSKCGIPFRTPRSAVRSLPAFRYPRSAVRSLLMWVGITLMREFITFCHFFDSFDRPSAKPNRFLRQNTTFTDLPPWKSATFTNFYGNFPKSVFFQQKRHLSHFCKSCQNPYLQQGVWTTFKVLKTPLLLLFRGVIGSKSHFLLKTALFGVKVVFLDAKVVISPPVKVVHFPL